MWTESSSVNSVKFGKYICYNFRDIKFFLGVTFWARLVVSCFSNSVFLPRDATQRAVLLR